MLGRLKSENGKRGLLGQKRPIRCATGRGDMTHEERGNQIPNKADREEYLLAMREADSLTLRASALRRRASAIYRAALDHAEFTKYA
jgi:hypothetical protein